MRSFEDERGRAWEVVVGRESWGAFLALFVPSGHDAEIRQTMLEGDSAGRAAREVESMDHDELLELFDRSEPKHPG